LQGWEMKGTQGYGIKGRDKLKRQEIRRLEH
jgi:hypothetical protein